MGTNKKDIPVEKQLSEIVAHTEAYLAAIDEAEKYNTSLYRQKAATARRQLDISIAGYRIQKPKKVKRPPSQGSLYNFYAQ